MCENFLKCRGEFPIVCSKKISASLLFLISVFMVDKLITLCDGGTTTLPAMRGAELRGANAGITARAEKPRRSVSFGIPLRKAGASGAVS